MGVFIQSPNRRPYAPPPGSDAPTAANANRSLLGGNDPNLIRVADGPASLPPDEDVQIAQQQPPQRRAPAQQQTPASKPSPPPAPTLSPAEAIDRPGRGYGVVPQEQIERGMSTTQKIINRSRALRDYASQQPAPGADLLPDDWEASKPRDLVDDIRRAAQRHGTPLRMLARLLYQEGRFKGPQDTNPKDRNPIVWETKTDTQPVGWAQMTPQTLRDLKEKAEARGDAARAKELESYSLRNREQAFDAAAERLAYSRRMLGSWPAAIAAYNMSPEYFDAWLKGRNASTDFHAPEVLLNKNGDTRPSRKWQEIANYLRNIVRGAPQDLQTADMYEPGNVRTGFRVASSIPPSFRPLVSGDTKDNP
jgi:hypothetical protein